MVYLGFQINLNAQAHAHIQIYTLVYIGLDIHSRTRIGKFWLALLMDITEDYYRL